jgi:Insulinase (Peptidase family M16)
MFVAAGARFENSVPEGTANYLARLAYKSTDRSTAFRRTVTIEQQTASFKACAQKEAIAYMADLPRGSVDAFVDETLYESLSPSVHEYEIRELNDVVASDSSLAASCQTSVVFDALYRAAFDDRTLGRPAIAPHYNVGRVTDLDVQRHVMATFSSPRIALVGVGVDHEQFVAAARRGIGASVPAAERLDGLNVDGSPSNDDKAVYIGGGRARIPNAGASTVGIAFDASSLSRDAFGVVAELVGGRHAAFTPFAQRHSDAALIGIVAGGAEQQSIVDRVAALRKGVPAADIEAARAVVAGRVADNLASRIGLFEHLAHGVITKSQGGTADSILGLATADIQKAIKQLLLSNVTIAAAGDVSNVLAASKLQ